MINQQCGNCRNAFAALRTIEKELHEEKEHNAELRKLAEAETEYDALEEACKRVMEERDEALAKLANLHFMHDGRLLDLKAVTAERDNHKAVVVAEMRANAKLVERAEKAESRAARYKEALEWYADPKTHEIEGYITDPCYPIVDDCGARARAALRDTEETSDEP